jgi:integrase
MQSLKSDKDLWGGCGTSPLLELRGQISPPPRDSGDGAAYPLGHPARCTDSRFLDGRKTAITRPKLDALPSALRRPLEGPQKKAPLLFGFVSGGRRRSEITAADWQDLRRIGQDAFIYRLEYSKTQQAGPSATATPDKPVLGRAGGALASWLSAANIVEGPPSVAYR